MKQLKISDSFSLPLDAVTRRMAILAMSGAGKSNLAVVIAEEMYRNGLPWVAIDPKGDWPGVRAKGTGPGLSVPIFGGLHGDMPLEPRSGAFIANLIVDQRLTCVLDVSEFDERQQMWGFLADFGETLLRKNRDPLHVFCEEADEYLPQSAKAGGNLSKCLGIWQRVIKRGRTHGLGTTQITQRSAALNKDTLYMAEAMFALRCVGKGDRKAVEGWVDHHAAAKEVVDSLPTLADGEGWVSSPAWLRRTERVKFSRRVTLDMGATPVVAGGKKSTPAKTLADVDLGAIRAAMAETIERAKQDDPRELRKRIAELEKAGKAKGAAAAPAKAEKVKRVEVPALSAKDRAVLDRAIKLVEKHVPIIHNALDLVRDVVSDAKLAMMPVPAVPTVVAPAPRAQAPMPRPAPGPRPRVATNGHATPAADLPKGELAVIKAAAMCGDAGASREQITLFSGYKRSTRDAYIQRAREKALLDLRGDQLVATAAGVAALGNEYEPLPTGDELRAYWLQRLPEGERKVLEAVCAAHPTRVYRDEIGESTGYKRSTRDAYIQRLATRLVIDFDRDGTIGAKPELFG